MRKMQGGEAARGGQDYLSQAEAQAAAGLIFTEKESIYGTYSRSGYTQK
jgi:hypothetical protein